jgi:hypothetical protein
MKEIFLVYFIQNNACVSSKLNSAANMWPFYVKEQLQKAAFSNLHAEYPFTSFIMC